MDDGSAVILSVAKYYSPAGKAIQDTGVTPSVPVVESEAASVDDDGNPTTVEPQPTPGNEDLLLKKAIEVVSKGKGAVAAKSTGVQDKGGPPKFLPPDSPQPEKQK